MIERIETVEPRRNIVPLDSDEARKTATEHSCKPLVAMKMKSTSLVILAMFALYSFGQTQKEYILKDYSKTIKPNPYQNQLDNLYPQPDSVEIYYIPGIVPPKLYALGKNSIDTIFVKYNVESIGFYNKTIIEYIDETDSTLWNDLDHVRFDVYINWDGDVFYIKASDVIGKFDKKKWRILWNTIQAIPSREEGILNEYRFSLPLTKRHSN